MEGTLTRSYRDIVETDSIEWAKRFRKFVKTPFYSNTLHFTLSYDFVPPQQSFLVVLTEDGSAISTKFDNTIRLLSLYKRT